MQAIILCMGGTPLRGNGAAVPQVMKASHGQANPALVQQGLVERLAQLRDG